MNAESNVTYIFEAKNKRKKHVVGETENSMKTKTETTYNEREQEV